MNSFCFLWIPLFTCALTVWCVERAPVPTNNGRAPSPALAPAPSCGRCEPRNCPRITTPCMCGTYLDACRCCPNCYKCPGDTCSILNSERCAGGKRCLAPPDVSPYMAIKYNGTCQ